MSFIVGIDLGTTNSTVSCTSLKGTSPLIDRLSIPQIGKDGEDTSLEFLPSCLLFPLKEERQEEYVVGEYAKNRGEELPSRLITSAKSWLSCDQIQRRDPILPFHVKLDDVKQKLSPVDVSKVLLHNLKNAWEIRKTTDPFKEQQVIVTVPASFDPSARELVIEAAEKADFPQITLIEEPLAAFYAWLYTHENKWRHILNVGDRVLVVDIGGGTTDFTLITVGESQGTLSLERVAVGSHLLLGGDNIDLALAYHAKAKLEKQGHVLDTWQFQSLVMQARKAKESLLVQNPPESVVLTIESKGSRLIGGTITTELTQEEVHKLVLEGFFPKISFEQQAIETRQSGISKIGLDFARDPRITAQLASFLQTSCQGQLPTKLLFNGGTMKSFAFQKQIIEQLNFWAEKQGEESIQALEGADLDFAVSLGAVYYGWTREKEGIRVKTGTSRSYFIGVEGAAPAVPGVSCPLNALCIVPFGTEEGSEIALDETFSLVVGEPTLFRFFSLCCPMLPDGHAPEVGELMEDIQELYELHPVETHLENQGVASKMVHVELHAKVTEMGMLELWCVEKSGKRWKLEFDIREKRELASSIP